MTFDLLIKFTKALAFFLIILASVAIVSSETKADSLTVPKEQTPKQVAATCKSGSDEACLKQNPIVQWLNFGINLLSVIILAGSAIMIAFAGIQYSTARDNPQTVQAAKQKIWGVVIGLLAYFFLYAIVQWLVPGGVF